MAKKEEYDSDLNVDGEWFILVEYQQTWDKRVNNFIN